MPPYLSFLDQIEMADNPTDDPTDSVEQAGEAVRRMAVDDPNAAAVDLPPEFRIEPGTGSSDETEDQRALRFKKANAKLSRWMERLDVPLSVACKTDLRGKLMNLLRLNIDVGDFVTLSADLVDALFDHRPAEPLHISDAAAAEIRNMREEADQPMPSTSAASSDDVSPGDAPAAADNASGDAQTVDDETVLAPPPPPRPQSVGAADGVQPPSFDFGPHRHSTMLQPNALGGRAPAPPAAGPSTTAVCDVTIALENFAHYKKKAANVVRDAVAGLQVIQQLEERHRGSGDRSFTASFHDAEDQYDAFVVDVKKCVALRNVEFDFFKRSAPVVAGGNAQPQANLGQAALIMSQQMQQVSFNVTSIVKPLFDDGKGRAFETFQQQWRAAVAKMSAFGWRKADFLRELRNAVTGKAANLLHGFNETDQDYDIAMRLLEDTFRDDVLSLSQAFDELLTGDRKQPTMSKLGFWIVKLHAFNRLQTQLVDKNLDMLELMFSSVFDTYLSHGERKDWRLYRAREMRDANKRRAAALGMPEEELPLSESVREYNFLTRKDIIAFCSSISTAAHYAPPPALSAPSTSSASSSTKRGRDQRPQASAPSTFHNQSRSASAASQPDNKRSRQPQQQQSQQSQQHQQRGRGRGRGNAPRQTATQPAPGPTSGLGRGGGATANAGAIAKAQCGHCGGVHRTARCFQLAKYQFDPIDTMQLKKWAASTHRCISCFELRGSSHQCDSNTCNKCGKMGHHMFVCGDTRRADKIPNFVLPPPVGKEPQ